MGKRRGGRKGVIEERDEREERAREYSEWGARKKRS